VHKNIRQSEVIVNDSGDHLPVDFHFLNHIRKRNLSDLVDKFTDWERFKSLASQIILRIIQINSGEEADNAARDFTAPTASAHRLSTN
jgi:hypothetical protein